MAVKLKSESELRIMREAGQVVGETLERLRAMVKPGANVLELEAFVDEEFARRGVKSPFLNYSPAPKYPPYPSKICISINDELVHGIPRNRVLREATSSPWTLVPSGAATSAMPPSPSPSAKSPSKRRS